MYIHSIVKISFEIIIIFLFLSGNSFSKDDSTNSDFRVEDKLRIRVAFEISNDLGDSVWKNWNTSPFAILLVTNDNEYLMNLENPSEDFRPAGFDSVTGSNIYTRARQFSINFLATFPAVNGISTIVVGQPENTSRQSLDWIVTVLHEHFHQLQSSQPDYYSSVDSLELAGDDKSGMWMLNYNFPYKDRTVSDQYKILTLSAKKTFLSIDKQDFELNLNDYISEREKFKSLLNKKDYDYFSFQIWQEGIARYTEIKIAELMKIYYISSPELTALEDYIPLDSFYTKIVEKLLEKADTQNLNENKRDCFYTLGALEGLILDKANPGWRDNYFKEKFYIEKLFVRTD